MFWVAAQGGAAIEELVRDTETVLTPLGIPSDNRAFTAHLTLARIKEPVPLQAPHMRMFPQPSGSEPHWAPWAAQVVGLHSHWLGVPLAAQV